MTSSLRQEELLQYAEAFDMYDVDDEQHILLTQLPLVLSTIGKTVPTARIEALKQRKADEGNDPYLTFDEFLCLIGAGVTVAESEKQQTDNRAAALAEALSLYDVEKNGLIPVAEARRALAEVISEAEFEGILHELGVSANGGEGAAAVVSIDAITKLVVGY